jgi:hypothetical protein
VVVATSSTLTKITASCATGKVAVGGGYQPGGSSSVSESYPSVGGNPPTSGQTPNGWTASFSTAKAGNTVYVICAN